MKISINLIGLCYFLASCVNNQNKMESVTNNYGKAFGYVSAYARYHKENLDESIKIKTENRFRADIGSAEFEFNKHNNTLIVRAFIDEYYIKTLINGDKPFLRDGLSKLNEEQKSKFLGGYLELDKTASIELINDPEFPLRLNLRKDIVIDEEYKITEKEFIKMTDDLTDAAYIFRKSRYTDFMRNGK